MTDDTNPITPEMLDKWLMAFPLSERKQKQARLADTLRVSKRTVQNWRDGRVIPDKHWPGIRDVMKGRDKVSLELEPALAEYLKKKATSSGHKSIQSYLEALSKLMAVALLLTLGHQIMHPEDGQPRRFGRRRQESAGVACIEDADAIEV